jgi:hypothetical protein
MSQLRTEKSLFKETMAASTSNNSRKNNFNSQPLDNTEKVSMPLHISTGLMKISV